MKIKILTLFFTLILLSSCSSRLLTEDDFLELSFGITETEVERRIGKPAKIFMNSEQVRTIDQEYSESSTDRMISADPNLFKRFVGGEEELRRVDERIQKSNKLSAYQYDYETESGQTDTWVLFFDEQQLIWMSFP